MHRAGWRAFTLVEMLVVIGIVVILAAILLPVTRSARQRARVFRCAANLQQLGVAIGLYVNDYRALPLVYPDRQPGVNGPSSPDPGGPNGPVVPPEPPTYFDARFVMGDYVSDPSVFDCPVASAFGRPSWATYFWLPGSPRVLIDPAAYQFNDLASGLKLSQVHVPASIALMMTDPGLVQPGETEAHLGKRNALFLDGHVKAYDDIQAFSPWCTNPTWPPD